MNASVTVDAAAGGGPIGEQPSFDSGPRSRSALVGTPSTDSSMTSHSHDAN